ncbi:putative pps1 dual specificty phosphatase protein [Botrytis fragariae]|uniref:Putative pps1 dual specificty phosphatase protein n=1 Tax=Botrytis fragariae TaxID=1964551 RepID=A0A8H6ANB0_9HELO|nr:putative pps1 dual specificty phosphatase protein [Botrytis fragariae]KAF5870385.1 putative pps1 dual specificty phosphatase protein [Botrytis fragariae]
MATIALPRPIPAGHTRSSSPPHSHPLTPTLSLDSINSSSAFPIPIPNKHLPVCPPGPTPSEKPDTPPNSPPTKELSLSQRSILYPPVNYNSRYIDASIIYEIDAAGVAAALEHLAGQPLPDPSQVFPWFHGLHPSNHIQQAFFIARRRTLRRTPKCIRGITIVKADGDLTSSRLKGAITPDEFLKFGITTEFQEVDPKEGFSVRNFQIQAAKSAMVSDIIVYGEDSRNVERLAREIAAAQQAVRETHFNQGHEIAQYNTFICTSAFSEFEENCPQIVSVDSRARWTGEVMDFFHQERVEMCAMTKASEIDHNVWLGPTPDGYSETRQASSGGEFDILIECNDLGQINPRELQDIAEGRSSKRQLGFPSSGMIQPPSWEHEQADGILETCKWIYNLSRGISPEDEDGDVDLITKTKERKILIHCTDGYTESTLLGLAYFTYATGLSIPKAWLELHTSKKRNFFAYPQDVSLLTTIAPRLLSESPVHKRSSLLDITDLAKEEPEWIKCMDGSLPSRVTDYMYLGNLGHANNPDLLRRLGIKQILSVGETATWKDGEMNKWGKDNVMVIQRVQDNGVDPLTDEFERCLDFIERGKLNNTATLVHCRVGVSRSATICIAEVMRTMHLSFPRAYCFVRARRLNVIIQPHLRFSYELLKWEEKLKMSGGKFGGKWKGRELEWADIAREIAEMNRPYSAGR